ncbi:MAG: plsY [Firmicutes bacterium]|nr:plsY [Bacillota bacterium]
MNDYLITILVSYLLGSVPSGLLIGKWLRGVDIRQLGSKNIGATNAFRILGPWPAFWVFFIDAVKGMAGVCLGQMLTGETLGLLAGGIAAIAGHNWSIFLKFKGGRGVATGLGVILILSPKVTLIVFLVWAFIVYITRYVSLGSIVAAVLVPFCMWLFGEKTEILIFGIFAALFVILKHRPNIVRLLHGEELKIKPPEGNGRCF